ncbi:MAG: DUF3599 family protein [Clostridia bacterium]|nr:DUF3599 family protein [Clostridia bacterium]
MSIAEFFDHSCDIYHLTEDSKSPGFNLPSSPTHDYPAEASLKGVECHFTVRVGNNTNLTQNEPQNDYAARTKLNLPVGTEIGLNDKVVDCDTGLSYTAVTPPRNIRGHHIIVYVERTREQKAL